MQFPLNYPLTLSFKIVALAPQLSVYDAHGNLLLYIRQKIFKLKEAVTVFADDQRSQTLYNMKADRVIDFSAQYHFTDHQGMSVGSVKRKGMRSIWKAEYNIFDGDIVDMTIREENAWIKIVDGLVGEIPILGMFTGYFFHPAYLVTRSSDELVMRMEKQPAFFEGKFIIDRHSPLSEAEEERALLSLIMMILLERGRG